ncbi:MAG: carbohydrate ABC transporter permease [Spirochaetia bacterium]|nr:carbohydrate ABC transporter permease [Spirochaetia bacterium]MCF7946750.1 carbohydrate ABC transporter permease [Spirochaetia bacterium]MCF7952462.1 carbohydrate ABC transporter permease [Spirochaetales bacterium]
MKQAQNTEKQFSAADFFGKSISYMVFISWVLITLLPLFWLGYSSFKSNEELTRDIFAFPHDLFDNYDDEYLVIAPQLNVIPDYDTEKDLRERLIIESKTIAPGRRLMIHFLVKEDLPSEIASLKPGDTLTLSQLPNKMRRRISWKTIWFNYSSAFQRGGLGLKFINSILYTTVSTFFIIFLGLMAAFGFSKMTFKKLSAVLLSLIGFGYLISQHQVIIPLFLMYSSVNLTDTHIGIIIAYIAFGLPISVLLTTQFMRGLPSSLIESAKIDGASTFRSFISIIMPMCKPVMVTVGIISALGIWNEFLMVLVLASTNATKSLPVGVYSFSSLTGTQLGWQLAALVIATAPTMVVYFSFQRQLTKGVVGGAVKG